MKPTYALAALALLGACAPALRAPDAAPADARAALLRLEDRREYDAGALAAAAASGDAAVRRRAALAAGRLRDARALPLLGRLLADADTGVAATAAFALGQVGDTAAVALLVPHLAAAPTVASEAAYALGKLRTDAAKQALADFLARTDPAAAAPEVAGSALLAVWRHPRPLPVAAVERWLEAADPELRARAAYALSRRADPAAMAALLGSEADPNPLVRASVARSLGAAVADSTVIGRDAALSLLLEMAQADADRDVRINALRTLGGYPDARSVQALSSAAAGDEPYLAIVAMESLQRLGADAASAAPLLEQVATDAARPLFLRQTALAALSAVDPPAALRVAGSFESSGEWRLRASAARALVRAGEDGRVRLSGELREMDGRVAAAALGELEAAVGDSVRQARFLAIEGLAHRDPVVRAAALSLIGRMGEAGHLSLAFDAYNRARADTLNDAALAAVAAIAALAPHRADTWPAFFENFPRSDDYLVRRAVAEALADTVANPWGEPLPVETGVDEAAYRAIAADAAARPLRRARIETSRGPIDLELFHADAPLTVRSFLSLAEAGYFDGQEWPRVVPNFVVQGGDPRGDTSGGPGYSIRDEINRHRYGRGMLGMALSGPDTGGSQWFLTHSPQPHLDGTYTIFGRVVSGWEALDSLLPGDRILSIREVR
jgi:cyclophilin family peptidyl-prolyl cis-trans isomerase/HEAT repeat protein